MTENPAKTKAFGGISSGDWKFRTESTYMTMWMQRCRQLLVGIIWTSTHSPYYHINLPPPSVLITWGAPSIITNNWQI